VGFGFFPGLKRWKEKDGCKNQINKTSQPGQKRRPRPADGAAIPAIHPHHIKEGDAENQNEDEDPDPAGVELAAEKSQRLFQSPEDELSFLRSIGLVAHMLRRRPLG